MVHPLVRTAADLAARDTYTPPFHLPQRLGTGAGAEVTVDAADLGTILRATQVTRADIRLSRGWFDLRCPVSGIDVAGMDMGELAARAIRAYRTWAEKPDASGVPLAWLVALSNDDELTTWLNLHHSNLD